MNATPWDMLDAGLVALAFIAVIRTGKPELLWGPAGLALYHLGGRFIINDLPNPAMTLAAAQTFVAIGFLFSRVMSNYGRIIGSLFLLMSMSGIIAVLLIMGALRHDKLHWPGDSVSK